MNSINRRQALKLGSASMLAVSLLNHMSQITRLPENIQSRLQPWKRRLAEAAADLGQGRISGLQWQQNMDRIYRDAPIAELLKMISFDDLRSSMLQSDLQGRGEVFVDIPIPGIADAASRPEPGRVLISKLAYIEKGRHIPPHGHSNMASAFLCVSGEFDVRLYDRLEETEDSMIVRKTAEQGKAGVGTWSSISDYRDNVHWLTARSENCFLFTCKVIRLEEHREFRGRINIDMRNPKSLGAGTFRAQKISFQKSREIY